MKRIYAPGCALIIHNPELVKKSHQYLCQEFGDMPIHSLCCQREAAIAPGTEVVNTCPGCDRKYRDPARRLQNISIWELIASSTNFPFPDYQGERMSINDACPTRNEARVHEALRKLLNRMNITLVESERTGMNGTCCGDSSYGKLPVTQVKEKMKQRAAEMPAVNVVVHCISCIKSMHIGGKQPRFMLDLLFGQKTEAGTTEPDDWHKELDDYIARH